MGIHGSDPEKWTVVLRRDPCSYCGLRHPYEQMTVDHIKARAKGAGKKHAAKNAAPACHGCNQAKGDLSLLKFLARRRLGVVVHRRVRREADQLLGTNPPAEWWEQVARAIASRELRARSVKLTDGKERAWWVVPVRSVDGVDLDLLVLARSFRRPGGRVLRVEILRLELGDEIWLPT